MNHRARKRFGQNFLVDRTVIARIADAVNAQPHEHLVEIGPGRAALTDALLESGAALSVIEIDRDLAGQLRSRVDQHRQLTVYEGDVLKQDFAELHPQPLRIVGNLPYNVSTPILFHLLRSRARIADMHFMLQKEVVQRITAAPGGGDYGRLSVAVAVRCRTRRLFGVGPSAFSPAPKVDSAILRLQPLPERPPDDILKLLDQALSQAFSARRKTLRNGLKSLVSAEALAALDIDPGCRPETVSPEQWLSIARTMQAG